MFGVLQKSLNLSRERTTTKATLTALFGGSTELTDEFTKKIDEFSLKTTHSTQNLYKWATMLKAMGMASDDIIPWLSMMGDASGNTDIANRMLMNIGQIYANKRAFGLDIKQFGFAGIPIKVALAEAFGKTVEEVGQMVTAGDIGYEAVFKAFEVMTKNGGIYEGKMAASMKKFTGKLMIMNKKWELVLLAAGKPLERIGVFILDYVTPLLDKLKEDGAFVRLFEKIAFAVENLFVAARNLLGGDSEEALSVMDALGDWIEMVSEKIELIAYLLFGIPEQYKKKGLTEKWIKDYLGISAIYGWIEEVKKSLTKYFKEDFAIDLMKGFGFALKLMTKGFIIMSLNVLKAIVKGLIDIPLMVGGILFTIVGKLLEYIPGIGGLGREFKKAGVNVLERNSMFDATKAAFLASGASVSAIVDGAASAFGFETDILNTYIRGAEDILEQDRNVKGDDSKGGDKQNTSMIFNVYGSSNDQIAHEINDLLASYA